MRHWPRTQFREWPAQQHRSSTNSCWSAGRRILAEESELLLKSRLAGTVYAAQIDSIKQLTVDDLRERPEAQSMQPYNSTELGTTQ